MEDNFKPLDCSDNDVLSFGDKTYKVGFLKKAMNQSCDKYFSERLSGQLEGYGFNLPEKTKKWFDEGVDCEILNLGSTDWKKGKVKVKFSVEFYVEPEEEPKINDPDSLDDLRKELNQDNS